MRKKHDVGKASDFEWVPTAGDPLPPEAMQELGSQIEKHLAEMWLKERIPALGNRTPVENQEARLPPGMAGGGFDIEKMRKRLGMSQA